MVKGPQPILLPHPLHDEPSVYWINDLARGELESVLRNLREAGYSDLAHGDEEAVARLQNARVSPEWRRRVRDAAGTVQPYLCWRRTRSVYNVHPRMTESLASLRSTTRIPASLFRGLRHPNPFLATPAAPALLHPDGRPGRVLGFYVTGAYRTAPDPSDTAARGGGYLLCDTHDEAADALRVMVLSEIHDASSSQVTELDFAHLTLPLTGEVTVDDLVQTVATGFSWASAPEEQRTEERKISYLGTLAHLVVSHLVYAVSRSFEVSRGRNDQPPAAGRAKDGTKPFKPAKIHDVGYRTGAAIADSLRSAPQRPAGTPTGRRIPAHIRAAHPHLYRVGPGRQEVDLKFLGPTPVNIDLDDGETTTVHPMGP